MRIVSLLPSATEILFAIGAGEDVIGVTYECDFPEEARRRRIVSTTALPKGLDPAQIDQAVRARIAAGEDLYHLDEGALSDIHPDLVVTQDLCAVCAVDISEVDAALDHLGCRSEVLTLDPMTLDGVIGSIGTMGRVTRHTDSAEALMAELRRRIDAVRSAVAGQFRPRTAVLEWTDPPFASGHWVPDMVIAAGGTPTLGSSGTRSFEVGWDDVVAGAPDVVVVAPCGFDLEGARTLAEQLVDTGHLPVGAPLWAVDADAAFARPGPRVVDGIEALAAILHPGLLPPNDMMAVAVSPSGMTERGPGSRR